MFFPFRNVYHAAIKQLSIGRGGPKCPPFLRARTQVRPYNYAIIDYTLL